MNSRAEQSPRLLMIRENLEAIPEFTVPAGFALRWYRAGNEAAWLDIHLRADQHNRITPQLFAQQFGTDSALLAERQCYLVDATGNPIGTATAWFDDKFDGRRIGRV